jgi:hypothetical protein
MSFFTCFKKKFLSYFEKFFFYVQGLVQGFQAELYVGVSTNIYSFSYESGAHIFINDKKIYTSYFEGFYFNQS